MFNPLEMNNEVFYCPKEIKKWKSYLKNLIKLKLFIFFIFLQKIILIFNIPNKFFLAKRAPRTPTVDARPLFYAYKTSFIPVDFIQYTGYNFPF